MDDANNNEPISAEDEAVLVEALKRAQEISDQISQSSEGFNKKTQDLKNKINAGLDEIEQADIDLQKFEQETANKLDALILEQAEDLSKEED